MSDGLRVMWMRGGTSKGGYFLADDLPPETAKRDRALLEIMGSPDPRQIDGLGGGDPLTSKIAVIRKSARGDADIDYLFLQVMVDKAVVTDKQNCGNILAGVGPFAIERGLIDTSDPVTRLRIYMQNTGQLAVATIATPGGRLTYAGEARIDGVPGTHAAIPIAFQETAGSTCGALLPTGNAVDLIDGVDCSLIDNGMPSVIIAASDMGILGDELPDALDANDALRARLEAIRLKAGPMMNLGEVRVKSVPKITMVSPPRNGGAISTRTFIPHRCHKAIGVLGAVTVATACLLDRGPAAALAVVHDGDEKTLSIEHPTGEMTIVATVENATVTSAAVLRTARKLFDGLAFPREPSR